MTHISRNMLISRHKHRETDSQLLELELIRVHDRRASRVHSQVDKRTTEHCHLCNDNKSNNNNNSSN